MRTAFEALAIRTGLTTDELEQREQRRTWQAPFTPISTPSVEQRAAASKQEAKPTDTPQELRLEGYSAVFDSDSELLYGFVREQIKRGAFKNVLKDPALDVRLLINHEGAPHARTTNGTLTLTEKPRGLYRNAVLDERRQDSRDLYYGVERGDFSQSSFAFTIKRSEWRMCDCAQMDEYAGCDCVWERDILEVGSLLDDSIVTYPAYPDATATVARASDVTTQSVEACDPEMVARDCERAEERDTQASDEELRDTASDSDTSLTLSVSDPEALLLRQWLYLTGVVENVTGTEGSARAR